MDTALAKSATQRRNSRYNSAENRKRHWVHIAF